MKIGSAICEKGQISTGYIHTAWLADGNEVNVPVMIAKSVHDGPVLWINAGVHGQEVSGIFAIQRLFKRINISEIRGTIVGTPGCNPLALKGQNKFTPEDQLDLDQQFPGKKDGWLSQQMAFNFFNCLKDTANYLIDLHSLGGVDAVPYTVYKTTTGVSNKINEDTEKMALLMGAEFNCCVDLRTVTGELPGSVMGALDIQCIMNGIPAMMFELGAGNRVIWENVEMAQIAFDNVMKMIGIIEDEPVKYTGQKVITKRYFPTNLRGGIVEPLCKPGIILKKGSPIVRIIDSFGNTLQKMDAISDCCILGVLENPIANAGTVIAAVGQKWYDIN